MLISVRYAGLGAVPGCYKYIITDDYLGDLVIDVKQIDAPQSMSGVDLIMIECCSATIICYSNNKQESVAANLAKCIATMFSGEFSTDDIININLKYNPHFPQYYEEIKKYLMVL